jgi:hypothetical protein
MFLVPFGARPSWIVVAFVARFRVLRGLRGQAVVIVVAFVAKPS